MINRYVCRGMHIDRVLTNSFWKIVFFCQDSYKECIGKVTVSIFVLFFTMFDRSFCHVWPVQSLAGCFLKMKRNAINWFLGILKNDVRGNGMRLCRPDDEIFKICQDFCQSGPCKACNALIRGIFYFMYTEPEMPRRVAWMKVLVDVRKRNMMRDYITPVSRDRENLGFQWSG